MIMAMMDIVICGRHGAIILWTTMTGTAICFLMEPEYHGGMVYPVMYPEIYYKVYPYVCRVGDEMIILYPLSSQRT